MKIELKLIQILLIAFVLFSCSDDDHVPDDPHIFLCGDGDSIHIETSPGYWDTEFRLDLDLDDSADVIFPVMLRQTHVNAFSVKIKTENDKFSIATMEYPDTIFKCIDTTPDDDWWVEITYSKEYSERYNYSCICDSCEIVERTPIIIDKVIQVDENENIDFASLEFNQGTFPIMLHSLRHDGNWGYSWIRRIIRYGWFEADSQNIIFKYESDDDVCYGKINISIPEENALVFHYIDWF